jgi:ATP-binding cassette subfamily B protein/subfamily B ATP-binding cassette protein MsbA
MYLMMLLMPVSMIVQSYGQTQQALAAMERVFDLLRMPADKPDRPNAIEPPLHAGPAARGRTRRNGIETFTFDNVSFAYQKGRRVLEDISLEVPGGATIALVGPSGAGKTTVTNLVARFYDPTEGTIRLNGIDLRDIKLAGYRRLLGLVQQDTFLFDGTVAENIAYGRVSATPAEIEDAARRANAHDFITGFADGYETIVGERGVRLSGGQAQRVSIARAILADPQILILDEATSNLDSESEQLIQASMDELLADRTTFVIAHRLSTVVRANRIVVLEAGRITETGTHDQLMAGDGRYRAMVERQQRAMDFDASAAESADWLA